MRLHRGCVRCCLVDISAALLEGELERWFGTSNDYAMTRVKPTLHALLETVIGQMQSGDWAAALTAVRDLTGGNQELNTVFFRLFGELRDMGRLKEAEDVLRRITVLFPQDQRAAFEYARLAYGRREWAEAIKRFRLLTERFANFVDGYRFLGDLLYAHKRYDEADAVIAEGMRRFPRERRLAVSYAWSAHLKGDHSGNWLEAHTRWRSLNINFPEEKLGYAMLGFVLSRYLNRTLDAEAILKEGMKRFADDIAIAREYARAADYRNDWAEAFSRWNALIDRWPHDRSLTKGRGETEGRQRLMAIDLAEESSSSHLQHIPAHPSQTPTVEGNLLLQFESLGENCEFGLVQRNFGIEPLGLLRWVSLSAQHLCEALEAQFRALDDPDDMEVRLVGPEYHIFGRKYGMRMHTYIVESEYKGTRTQLQTQLLRRTRYLRDKFLDDLSSGEKLFLWQSGVGSPLAEETVLRMRHALRSYGRNTLVVIRRDNDATTPPIVESRMPGLIEGRLHQVDKVTTDGGTRAVSVSPFGSWLTLCRAILEVSERDRQGTFPPDPAWSETISQVDL